LEARDNTPKLTGPINVKVISGSLVSQANQRFPVAAFLVRQSIAVVDVGACWLSAKMR